MSGCGHFEFKTLQILLRKYSRVLRSVETKERELERKIRETDAILREVKSLKVGGCFIL